MQYVLLCGRIALANCTRNNNNNQPTSKFKYSHSKMTFNVRFFSPSAVIPMTVHWIAPCMRIRVSNSDKVPEFLHSYFLQPYIFEEIVIKVCGFHFWIFHFYKYPIYIFHVCEDEEMWMNFEDFLICSTRMTI